MFSAYFWVSRKMSCIDKIDAFSVFCKICMYFDRHRILQGGQARTLFFQVIHFLCYWPTKDEIFSRLSPRYMVWFEKHFFLNSSFHCCIIVWTDSLLVYNLLTISLTSSRVKRLSCPFTSHCLPWVKSDVNHDYSFVFVRVLLLLHYASFSHVFLTISFLMTKLLPFTVKSCGNRIDWFIC